MKYRLVAMLCGLVLLACAGCGHLKGTQVDEPEAGSALRLPSVIGDHMVLQRGIAVPIWGWAASGDTVSVQLGPHEAASTANSSGEWKVMLPAMEAGGPYDMTVEGRNTILLKDILIGEVWICSGQSNMEMGIRSVNNAEREIAAANYPDIRLFNVPWKTSGYPQSDLEAQWRRCTPENVSTGGVWGAGFSAAAYFFGRELHQELDVPIGLIDTSWGGTRIEPWTPPEGFAQVPALEDIVRQVEEASPKHRKALKKAVEDYVDWLPLARKALDRGERVPSPPEWPKHPLDANSQPTGIYNAMVHPLVPFGIRGALWYQGESNKEDGMLYHEKMKALIGGWRQIWDEGDFPFYFVQLAPFDSPIYAANELPMIWEAQTATLSVPNTGMVVTTDITDLNDIHPKNKQDVGKRLALWALAKTYGRTGQVYSGPLYKSMTVEGDKVRLKFDHAGSGLASRDGKPLSWFEIAGADRKYVQAQARIEGNTVIVWSEKVKEPAAVRFGWSRRATPNLANREGLPASPFRTDRWDYTVPEDGAFVRKWNVIGPFELGVSKGDLSAWEEPLPPEQNLDLNKSLVGKEGRKIRWQTIVARESGYVDLDRAFGQEEDAVACAVAYVYSPEARKWEMRAGSDDGIAAQVNGKEVWRKTVQRNAVADEDVFSAELKQGWNEVLLKVADYWGGYGFYFRIIDPEGKLKFALKPGT